MAKTMGSNSFITHRMFVAALNHDETMSAKEAQSNDMDKTSRQFSANNPWDAHINALAKAKGPARSWPAPSQASL